MKKVLEKLNGLSFITFYGSQLGQAESIAESIVDKASEYDFVTQAFPLNDIGDVTELDKLNCPIVIITSTTGDGEPPENADKFWRKIRRKALKPGTLSSLRYAILGLGDTNYNNFCNCGKEIQRRLQELGAITFHPPGWADDAVGLELVVDDWLDDLWTALENFIRPGSTRAMDSSKKEGGGMILPMCPPDSLILEYPEQSAIPVNLLDPIVPYPLEENPPVKGTVIDARCLTNPGSVKTTLEVKIKFQSKKFDFEPGDAIGVVSSNPPDEVQTLLQRLDILEHAEKAFTLFKKENTKGKIPVHIPPGCTIRQAFLYYCDIRTPPRKAFIRLLAEYTDDDVEKNTLLELCSRQGSTQFENKIRLPSLSLLDLLLGYPSCRPKVEVLIEHLPRLIPRAYSISSSPLESNESFTFAFNVITFTKEDGRKYNRTGICTGWLYNLCKDMLNQNGPINFEEDLTSKLENLSLTGEAATESAIKEIVIYKRKNHNFRLPEDLYSPVIMVGPGTGVAPFIGFVEHRDRQKKEGKSIGNLYLYFGCRNKELDFLYKDKLQTLCDEGSLTKLYASFSRDDNQGEIKYVQHNLDLNKEEVISILFDQGGYLYVCGDAKNMAKNVRDTLMECVQTIKGVTEAEAKTLVTDLGTSKRYLQDVWN